MHTEERAAVALVHPGKGTVKSVMVENLTLPHQLGEMLVRHYTDRIKIWRLLQLGDMLSVGVELGTAGGPGTLQRGELCRVLPAGEPAVRLRRPGQQGRRRTGTPPGVRRRVDQWEMGHVDCRRYLYDPRIGESGIWLYGEPGISEKRSGMRPNTMMPLEWIISRWKRWQRMARAAAARA